MEVVKANIRLILSHLQVVWFKDNISKLTKKPTSSFLEKEEKDADGRFKLSKSNTTGNWSMRCIVWPKAGGRLVGGLSLQNQGSIKKSESHNPNQNINSPWTARFLEGFEGTFIQ